MTDEEFKKKLLADLGDLYGYICEERKIHTDKIIFDNYMSVLSNAYFAIRDSLPHLLSVEEIKNKEDKAVYIEFRRRYGDRYCYISNYGFRDYICISYCGIDENEYLEFASYNKTWRIWNTEPTVEQMKEVPWDDD